MLMDVANYLASKACGTVGTDIFVGELPPTPQECLAVVAEPADEQIEAFDGPQIDRPIVRILGRGNTYSVGRRRIDKAFRALIDMGIVTFSGRTYSAAIPFSSPYYFDLEETSEGRERPIFAVDFELWRTPITA